MDPIQEQKNRLAEQTRALRSAEKEFFGVVDGAKSVIRNDCTSMQRHLKAGMRFNRWCKIERSEKGLISKARMGLNIQLRESILPWSKYAGDHLYDFEVRISSYFDESAREAKVRIDPTEINPEKMRRIEGVAASVLRFIDEPRSKKIYCLPRWADDF